MQPHDSLEPRRLMTVEEWGALDEDEPGELVDGVLVEEEDVGYLHEVVVLWLGEVLRRWIVARGGSVAGSDARFGVRPRRGRKPDLSAYFPGRKPAPHGVIQTPPDLMVEVVSPTPKDARRDRVEKLHEYRAFGVRFYWIVDPGLRTLEIFEITARGTYEIVLSESQGAHDVPGCEGLRVDLDALWAEVDRLLESATETEGTKEP
jgi:Uma2 family endonuclease